MKKRKSNHHHHTPVTNRPTTAAVSSFIDFLRALFPIKTVELADRLVAGHASLMERTMRTKRLSEKLLALPDDVLVDVVDHVFANTRPGDLNRARFILSVVDIFSLQYIPPTRLLKLYNLSRNREQAGTPHIFMAPAPKKTPFGEYDFVEGRELEYLTLGEKRSLARTHTKDTLDRLLYDTNPMVVKNILENPSLTEPDVLKMASRRPNSEKVLSTIYKNDRWVASYNIKLAIVRNPYTPVAIALGLLLFLKKQDIDGIASDSTLHEVIMTTARAILSRRETG